MYNLYRVPRVLAQGRPAAAAHTTLASPQLPKLLQPSFSPSFSRLETSEGLLIRDLSNNYSNLRDRLNGLLFKVVVGVHNETRCLPRCDHGGGGEGCWRLAFPLNKMTCLISLPLHPPPSLSPFLDLRRLKIVLFLCLLLVRFPRVTQHTKYVDTHTHTQNIQCLRL